MVSIQSQTGIRFVPSFSERRLNGKKAAAAACWHNRPEKKLQHVQENPRRLLSATLMSTTMEREEHRERQRNAEQAIRGSHDTYRLLGGLQFPCRARKAECSKLQFDVYYLLKHFAGMFSSAHAYVQNCSSRMYGQIALNPNLIRDFMAMWRQGA